MGTAKVTLSPKERDLVTDPTWILTKNGIIQKVYALFGSLSTAYEEAIGNCQLNNQRELLALSPKISKGEQYEGLPWVMLDQPRHYKKSESFGIRTFFWWGNSFSITLQLTGRFKEMYAEAIGNYFGDPEDEKSPAGLGSGWLAGIGEDEWQHHFREDNYVPVESVRTTLADHPFIKLTKRYPLSEWDNMEELLLGGFREILCMLDYQALPKR